MFLTDRNCCTNFDHIILQAWRRFHSETGISKRRTLLQERTVFKPEWGQLCKVADKLQVWYELPQHYFFVIYPKRLYCFEESEFKMSRKRGWYTY